MKKRWIFKKGISMVLAVCLLATLFAGFTVGTFAAGTYATEVIYCGHTLNAQTPYLIISGVRTGGIKVSTSADKQLWGAENLLAEFDAETGTLTYKSGMMVESDTDCYEQDFGWNSYCDAVQIGEDYYGIKANGDLTIDLGGHKNFIYANWNKIFTCDLYGIYAQGDVTIKGDGYLKLPATLAMNNNSSKGDGNANPHYSYGIYAEGDVYLEGGTVSIFSKNLNRQESGSNANSIGVYAGGKTYLNGATLKFRYEESVGQGRIVHFSKNPEGIAEYTTNAITNITMTGSLGSLGYCYVNNTVTNNNCYDYIIPQSATGVMLSRRNITLEKGKSMILSAVVVPYEAENKNVTWASSNPRVASVTRGKIVGVSKGTATITVTTKDGGYTASCTVEVSEKEIPEMPRAERVELDRTEFDLSAGSSRVLGATVYPKNSKERRVVWTSSDENVAVVDGGKVTAIAPGRATITAKTIDGGFADSCVINVPGEKTNATEVIYCGKTLNAQKPYLVGWVIIGQGLLTEARETNTLSGDEFLLAEFDAGSGTFTYKSGMELTYDPGCYENDYIWNTYTEATQIGEHFYGIKANGDLVVNLGDFNNFIYCNWNKLFTCNLYGIYADGDVTINGGGNLKIPATFAMNTSSKGDGNANPHYSYGIYAEGDVNLNGGTITIFSKVWMEGQTGSNAHSVGIYAGDKINLNATKLKFRYEENIGQGQITHFSKTPVGLSSYNKVPVENLKMKDGTYASLGFCYVDKNVVNHKCFDYDLKDEEAESKERIFFTKDITLLIDGAVKETITPVKLADNGVVYVPLVETFSFFGITMNSYKPNTYAGYGNNGEIVVRVGESSVDIDWVDVELPSPVTKLGGVTMIPAYILEDALKTSPAVYDAEAGTLSVKSPDPNDVFWGDTRSDVGERVKSLIPGEPLLTQQDILPKTSYVVEGGYLEVSEASVEIDGVQTTALQLETLPIPENIEPEPSDIVTNAYKLNGTGRRDFADYDTGYVRFKARTLNADNDANAARLAVYYERSTEWSKLFTKDIVVRPGEWMEYYIPVCAIRKGTYESAEWDADTSRLVFGVGKDAQILQIADFEMIYYGQTVDIEDIDPYFYSYYGIDDDALWRKEAWRKIEKHRKEDVEVTVVDQNGNPVEGAEITVKQTESDFMFGIEVCHNEILNLDLTGEIGRAMDNAFNSFNTVVCGLEMKSEKVIYSDGVRGMYMADEIFNRGKRLRGHAVLWDSDTLMNVFSPTGNYREMEYEDIYQNVMDYVEPYVYAYKGKVVQWDVLNEPSYWNYLRTHFDTTRLYTDVLKAVRRIDPDTKLYVNEFDTEGKDKGEFTKKMGTFLDIIRRMKDEGAPIDGLGLQTHADNYHHPWGLYRQIDECAQLVDQVSITEYDFGNDNAKETDRYKYMLDHLVATVAHPKSSSFVVWGYRALSATYNKGFFYDMSWNELPFKAMWDEMVHEKFKTNLSLTSDEDGRADFRGYQGDYEITVSYGGTEKTFDFGTLKDGANWICITIGDDIDADVSSGKTIIIPESVEHKSVTDAELHYRNNVSTIPYREVLLDANLKNLLSKGLTTTTNSKYLNGEKWGSNQNIAEIATDRYQNRGVVFNNSKAGNYSMNRLYSGSTFENGNLELSTIVETFASRKAGFELELGLGDAIFGKVKTSEQGYFFETLAGRRAYLADNTIYDIQITLMDTGYAGVYDVKYAAVFNNEVVFEIIEEQDKVEDITALDRILMNINTNGAESADVLVLRLARAMFCNDGTYEFENIGNNAEVISDSMYEFAVNAVVSETDEAYLNGDAWGTNTNSPDQFFKFYYETQHVFGTRTAPAGEKTLKKKMVKPTAGESLDVEFDFYIATPQQLYDSNYCFEVRLENADGTLNRTLARCQNGTLLQLLANAGGSFATQKTVEYNDIVGITTYNKNNLRVLCRITPNSSGGYDAALTLVNAKSVTAEATLENFLTAGEFEKLDTFTIASETTGAGSRYGNGVAGVKNVIITKTGKTAAYEGGLMAFEEGDFAGIRFDNPTKRPMDAQVMLVRYAGEKFSSVDVYDFDDRKQEDGYLSLPITKKYEDEDGFRIMLVDGENNMLPLKAADDIVIY